MSAAINPTAMLAIARRQLGSFLANPLGYIFILAFVVITAAATFVPDQFFRRNIADFGVIYDVMPWILMVLLPALAMSAWSSEREHGTEELLLTMPVSVADAVLGKYLAIAGFFSIAMVCNLSNVVMLSWLGDPDGGQLAANLLGWWLLGLGYGALALLGSAMVASNAIAFVLGVMLCAIYALISSSLDLLSPFDRGLLSFDLVVLTVAVAAAGLGAAIFVLASRRWQADRMGDVTVQIACLVLAILVAVNLGRISQRWHLQTDLSAAGLSSLTESSNAVVADLPYPAEVTIVISDDSVLPERLDSKVQEVLYKARALERVSGGDVAVQILRPKDPYDAEGRRARDSFGLEARSDIAQTVVGNEEVEVFLGAVVTCGSKTQTIDYFEPGLSVEYELVRALRTVTAQAGPKPAVAVTLVASETVPAAAQARLDALLAWAEDGQREGVSVAVERVADAAAAADTYDLELLSIEVEPEPAADAADDAADADAAAEAADAETAADEPAPTPEPVDIVLGAVVTGPSFGSRVRAFEDAEGIDADLRQAIREARRKLPVLGVLDTALDMNGGFDMRAGQLPTWGIVSELGKQYDVRQIAAGDLAAASDVDALLVALPSSLAPEDIDPVIDWIWAGKPTLLLVDPLPMFSIQQGRMIAPGMPPEPQGQQMPGMPPQPGEPKAGIDGVQPLLKALGLRMDLAEAIWSNYTPSFEFTQIPKEFVWVVDGAHGTIAANGDELTGVTTGVHSLIMPAPGFFELEEGATTAVSPLVALGTKEPWGRNDWDAYVTQNMFGQQMLDFSRRSYSEDPTGRKPILAAHVGGVMTHPGSDAVAAGTKSAKPVNVIAVADVDFIHDGIFNIYRNVPTGPDSEAPAELTRLRNVQFVENAVDVLVGNDALIELRAARPGRRSLTTMETMRSRHRQANVKREIEATEAAQQERERLRQQLDAKLAAIMARPDMDQVEKQNLRAYEEQTGNKKLAIRVEQIDHELEVQKRQMAADFREAVSSDRLWMRWWMVGIPSVILLTIVGLVTAVRVAKESTDIPSSRDRRKA